jgi:hypothetical protein
VVTKLFIFPPLTIEMCEEKYEAKLVGKRKNRK